MLILLFGINFFEFIMVTSGEIGLFRSTTSSSVENERVCFASRAEITLLAYFAESFTPITQVLPVVNALRI